MSSSQPCTARADGRGSLSLWPEQSPHSRQSCPRHRRTSRPGSVRGRTSPAAARRSRTPPTRPGRRTSRTASAPMSASFPDLTYDPAGSGAGRRVMGERTAPNADGSLSRNQVPRYGMTDEPPTPTAVEPDEPGHRRGRRRGHDPRHPGRRRLGRAGGELPGQLRPGVAAGLGGDEPGEPPTRRRSSTACGSRARRRRRSGTATRPTTSGTRSSRRSPPTRTAPGSSRASCGSTTRARRSRSRTGSTRSTRPATGTRASRPAPTRATGRTRASSPRPDCNPTTPPTGPLGTHLTSGCSNGNGSLMAKLNATDGSVGYSDIATARSNGLGITPTSVPASRDDDRFWTQTTNPSGTFVEADGAPERLPDRPAPRAPTASRSRSPASRPRRSATGRTRTAPTRPPVGSSARSRTASLFDDYKGPYSLQGAGDVGRGAEGEDGQGLLGSRSSATTVRRSCSRNDYSQLPSSILNIARNGVNAVCWDKPGTGPCPTVRYFYPRPCGATPFRASLVPAYNACTVAQPPARAAAGVPVLQPAVQSSGSLTIGTPDANGARRTRSGPSGTRSSTVTRHGGRRGRRERST